MGPVPNSTPDTMAAHVPGVHAANSNYAPLAPTPQAPTSGGALRVRPPRPPRGVGGGHAPGLPY